MPYEVVYSPTASEHFRGLSKRQQIAVRDAVNQQLRTQPNIETRNRKRMRPNPLAPWELRIGTIRVFYEVNDDPKPVVQILAIGIKRRNQYFIAGKEIKL